MDEPLPEPVMAWRFIRRHFVRIVIGVVLATAVYFAISVYATYKREQRIARALEAQFEEVTFRYSGPECFPQLLRDRMPFFDRIVGVGAFQKLKTSRLPPEVIRELSSLTSLRMLVLRGSKVTDEVLPNLKGLKRLERLHLDYSKITDAGLRQFDRFTQLVWLGLAGTRVTDAGMEFLKTNTSLVTLDLTDTHITDAGLEHLKGLTNLKILSLVRTQTTAEGRTLLRKALPNCEIWSETTFGHDVEMETPK